MPSTPPIGKTDQALTSSVAGALAVSAGPTANPVFDARLTWDADTAAHTVDGASIKPNNKPIHFETPAGPTNSGVRFTYCTNLGGHPFEDSEGNVREDNVITWGWNLGGDYNSAWNPDEPTIYDTMEEAYLRSDGSILGEYNYEGTHTSWPAARRWRSMAVDHANGHGNAQYCHDYAEWRSNSGQYSMFQIGVSTNNGFGPFGVYEVELTGGFSVYNGMGEGYTDGTGYDLIFTGGGGTGAAGKFDVVAGKVKNVSLSNTGWGYTSAPTVSFANGGPGTGVETRVQIGSITGTLPLNTRNVISGAQYWLADSAGANRYQLVAALNRSSGAIYSGFNLTEVAGAYQHLTTGALSGVEFSSSGGIKWYAKGSQSAGTAATPTMSLTSLGGLTLTPTATTTYLAVTLPAVQSDNLINIVKPGTLAPVFQVTKDGYVGNNAGSGVTAPIDVTRTDTGNIAQFGANGVKSLCTIAYGSVTGSDITITGSGFGPTQLRSGSNQDLNLLTQGTGKIGLKAPVTVTDAKDITLGTTTGTKFGTAATQKLGFFGATPIVQPTLGAATAGDTYTAVEKAMLQAVYDALRNLGLGS